MALKRYDWDYNSYNWLVLYHEIYQLKPFQGKAPYNYGHD